MSRQERNKLKGKLDEIYSELLKVTGEMAATSDGKERYEKVMEIASLTEKYNKLAKKYFDNLFN